MQKTKVSPVAQLTPEQVRSIRRKLDAKVSQTYLAEFYHVSQATISKIKSRKVYKDV